MTTGTDPCIYQPREFSAPDHERLTEIVRGELNVIADLLNGGCRPIAAEQLPPVLGDIVTDPDQNENISGLAGLDCCGIPVKVCADPGTGPETLTTDVQKVGDLLHDGLESWEYRNGSIGFVGEALQFQGWASSAGGTTASEFNEGGTDYLKRYTRPVNPAGGWAGPLVEELVEFHPDNRVGSISGSPSHQWAQSQGAGTGSGVTAWYTNGVKGATIKCLFTDDWYHSVGGNRGMYVPGVGIYMAQAGDGVNTAIVLYPAASTSDAPPEVPTAGLIIPGSGDVSTGATAIGYNSDGAVFFELPSQRIVVLDAELTQVLWDFTPADPAPGTGGQGLAAPRAFGEGLQLIGAPVLADGGNSNQLHYFNLVEPVGGEVQPAVEAAYWRIKLTKTRDAGTFKAQLAEVEFRATVGGADQASGGTAIASSTWGAPNEPGAAFDDNAATSWAQAGETPLPQYIGYQFAAPVSVGEVLLRAADTADRALRAPEDFTVDYSDDGLIWTTYAQFTGEYAWAAGEARTYAVSAPVAQTEELELEYAGSVPAESVATSSEGQMISPCLMWAPVTQELWQTCVLTGGQEPVEAGWDCRGVIGQNGVRVTNGRGQGGDITVGLDLECDGFIVRKTIPASGGTYEYTALETFTLDRDVAPTAPSVDQYATKSLSATLNEDGTITQRWWDHSGGGNWLNIYGSFPGANAVVRERTIGVDGTASAVTETDVPLWDSASYYDGWMVRQGDGLGLLSRVGYGSYRWTRGASVGSNDIVLPYEQYVFPSSFGAAGSIFVPGQGVYVITAGVGGFVTDMVVARYPGGDTGFPAAAPDVWMPLVVGGTPPIVAPLTPLMNSRFIGHDSAGNVYLCASWSYLGGAVSRLLKLDAGLTQVIWNIDLGYAGAQNFTMLGDGQYLAKTVQLLSSQPALELYSVGPDGATLVTQQTIASAGAVNYPSLPQPIGRASVLTQGSITDNKEAVWALLDETFTPSNDASVALLCGEIVGTDGRIVVTDGAGQEGNPTIDLAEVTQGETGALLALEVDAWGRVISSRAVVADDIPEVPISKVAELQAALNALQAQLDELSGGSGGGGLTVVTPLTLAAINAPSAGTIPMYYSDEFFVWVDAETLEYELGGGLNMLTDGSLNMSL